MTIIADAIFCDDIRQEMTGKLILLGVYPSDLVLTAIPSKFPMSIMMRIHGLAVGAHDFEFALTSPPSARILQQKGQGEVLNRNTPLVVIFSGIPMELDQVGELVASVKIAGNDLIAGRLQVLAAPGADASSLQPSAATSKN